MGARLSKTRCFVYLLIHTHSHHTPNPYWPPSSTLSSGLGDPQSSVTNGATTTSSQRPRRSPVIMIRELRRRAHMERPPSCAQAWRGAVGTLPPLRTSAFPQPSRPPLAPPHTSLCTSRCRCRCRCRRRQPISRSDSDPPHCHPTVTLSTLQLQSGAVAVHP